MPTALIAGGLGLASAAIQGSAARKAAKSQETASREQLKLQEKVYQESKLLHKPFLEAGTGALPAYMFEMGLADRPEGYGGMEASPYFDFMLTRGRDVMESGAAAGGRLWSGATGEALERYRLGLAQSEASNWLNRLANLTTLGQASAGQQAAAGQNFATGAGTAYANIGNAQAAGAIGMGNAIASGIDLGFGAYGFLNQQQPAPFYGVGQNPALNTPMSVRAPYAGGYGSMMQ